MTCSRFYRLSTRNRALQGILALQMDPKQIDELRRWGQRLSRDEDQPELRSAGRAILMLIQEVESLQTSPPTEPPADEPGAPAAEQAEPPRPRPSSRRSHRVRGMRR